MTTTQATTQGATRALPPTASRNDAPEAHTAAFPGDNAPALDLSFGDFLRAINPLQHIPVVGMLYRAATGDTIPEPLRIAGAGLTGGPLGMIGAAVTGLATALLTMPPDTSRPLVPAGMKVGGSQSAVEPTTPGTLPPGAYTTIASVPPAWTHPLAPSGTALAAYERTLLERERLRLAEAGAA